jgi:poly(ADP-ribose) glycohydrolase
MRQSNNFDNDINDINNLLNEQHRDQYEEPNIEEILERNQRDIKENRYKESILSKYPREQYFNSFITVKEDIKTSPRLSVSKEHFYIPKEPKEADHKELVVESVDEKLKNSEYFKTKEREKEKYFELEKLKEKEKLIELEREHLKEKERLLDIEKERIKGQPRDIGRESRLSAFTNDMNLKTSSKTSILKTS